MRRSLLVLLALSVVVVAFGQRSGGRGGGGGLDNKADPKATPTLHTGVKLVLIDIVVQDKNKQPVHGLKATDFTVQEDGVSQTFKSFEEHTAPIGAEAAKIAPPAKLPPGVFSNFAAAKQEGPLDVLVLDRLNTPLQNQSQMITQINEYLANVRVGTRMAIFGMTDKLMLLQGFTDDPQVLKDAVNKNGGLVTSQILNNKVGSETPPTTSEMVEDATGFPAPAEMVDFEIRQASFETQIRAKYTLNELSALAHYLATFPGRKNLIWFSGSFPVNVLPDSEQGVWSQFSGVESMETEFRQTSALLSRSQVAVYPIDVKGVEVNSFFTAASSSNGADPQAAAAKKGGKGVRSAINKVDQQTYDEHSAMNMMADDTGGKASIMTNDLTASIFKAIDDGANYYTIAYTPTAEKWDGKFRSIAVKLAEQGYTLSYRRGYFADDVDPLGNLTNGAASTISRSMQFALMHGGPEPTQLLFSVGVHPVSANSEADLAPRNTVSKGINGPYRRYRVDFAIDPRAIHFTQGPDGNRHETLEFVTYVFDADGKQVDWVSNAIKTVVTPAEYEQFRQTGVPFHHDVSVPVKGEHSLRIAMHDVEADLVGAVELPVGSVQNLRPLEAAGAVPAAPAK